MSSQVSTTKKLVSASALMAAGTMISRVLGLVRVMLIVFILGNGTRQADILSLATSVPNSLYILFAGGALNTVLVPQIVRAIKHDDDGGEAYTNRIMTAFMLIVGVVAVVVTIGAPVVTSIYSGSAWRAPELTDQYASMVALAYLTLPQVFFYGVFFLLGQVLNARDRFGPMMWAPIANNVIAILVLGTYLVIWGTGGDHSTAFSSGQIWVLGLGSTIGIAAQTAVLIPYLRKVGFRFRPRFDLKGTGLGKTFSLTKWTIGFVAVNQLALVVVQRLATSATAEGAEGGAGLTVYANAHLLWILPHSLITVSLATAMLPNASRLAASNDMGGVAAESTKTMRLALVALVPAAVGFIALSGPITQLLFGNGRGTQDALWVGWALAAFALGLVPFTVQFMCLRTYYAIEDTRTPFLLQCAIAAVNAGGAVLLVWWVSDPTLVAAALALAYSLAYTVGVLLSWHFLKRRVPLLDGGAMLLHILRLVLSATLGGVAAYFAAGAIMGSLPEGILASGLAVISGLAIIGAVYAGFGKLLKVHEFNSLTGLIASRFGRRTGKDPADTATEISTGALAEDLMPTMLQPAIRADDAGETPPDGFDPESVMETRIRPAVVINDQSPTEGKQFGQEGSDVSRNGRSNDDDFMPALGSAGQLLSTRYRLEERLARRGSIESWRAHDLQLSRDVLAHVMPVGDPRIPGVLDAARTGAAATDSRFLRVLDAVALDEDGGVGGYVVCEYAAGTSLAQMLGSVQLSTLEAAWIVRELADALSAMHTNGLFHEQLTPENVIITTSGAVRLVGFGVESVLAESERPTSWSAKEEADVTALAALLYALLTNHWPGRAAWGLPAAPTVAGHLVGPQRLREDVPSHLDRICSSILSDGGVVGEARISTASQLAAGLSSVLGSANPSPDLEDRIRPGTNSALSRTASNSPALSSNAPNAAPSGIAPNAPQSSRAPLLASLSSPATKSPGVSKGAPSSTPATAIPAPARSQAHDMQETRVGSRDDQRETPSIRRPLLWIILALAVATLVVSLIALAAGRAGDEAGESVTSAATTTADGQSTGDEVTIVSGVDFDPEADGGNAEENPSQVDRAFDGNPDTGWSTVRYHNRPNLGGLKPGVGIVLDLGEARDISSVDVQFSAPGTSVELRVPTEADPEAAPMTTQAQWRVVASQEQAEVATALVPTEPTTTRFLLVYLTELPEVSSARYLSEITGIVVNG